MPKTKLGTGNDVVALAMRSEELEWFIEWLAIPSSERPANASSQAKVAVLLSVTEQTLRNWKRDPRVQSKVAQIRTSRLRVEDLPDVFRTLLLQATDVSNPRSVSAAKLLIEEANRLVDEHQTSQELKSMSVAELKDLVSGLYDELDDRDHASSG